MWLGATGGFFAPSQNEFFVTAGDHLSELALDEREPLATATFGSLYDTPALMRSDGNKAVSFDVVNDHTSAWDPDAALPVGEASNLSDNVPYFYTSAGDQRWGVDFTTGTAVIEDDDGRVVQRSNWKLDTDPKAIGAADPLYQVYGLAHSDGTGLVLHDTTTLAAIPMLAKFAPARDSTFVVSRDLSTIARASRDRDAGLVDHRGRRSEIRRRGHPASATATWSVDDHSDGVLTGRSQTALRGRERAHRRARRAVGGC